MTRPHYSRISALQIGLSLALLTCAQNGNAATHCVSTSAELSTALNASSNNGENDVVRIKTGTYTRPAGGLSAFGYGTSENFDIAIEGGWVTFLTFDCGRQVRDPKATVLSGSGNNRVLRMVPGPDTSGAMSVENLTIRDGVNPSENGGGLLISGSSGIHDIRVEHVFFDGNEAQTFGGGAAIVARGTLIFRNNTLFANRSGSGGNGAHLTALHTNSTTLRSFIGNNTVVANMCDDNPSCNGMTVFGTGRAVVYNNAFVANETRDLDLTLQGGATADLFNNNIGVFNGTPANMSGNISAANVQFVDGLALDFRIQFASPLRDAGTTSFALGDEDFNGLDRINGNGVDIGAYENDEIVFRNGFEPPQQ